MEQFNTSTFIKRLIPAVVVWAVGQVLENPRIRKKAERIDKNVHRKRRDAVVSMRVAGRNAKRHPGWLAAGAAAMLIGVGLIARSTRPK